MQQFIAAGTDRTGRQCGVSVCEISHIALYEDSGRDPFWKKLSLQVGFFLFGFKNMWKRFSNCSKATINQIGGYYDTQTKHKGL
jgi:hypothetical protein